MPPVSIASAPVTLPPTSKLSAPKIWFCRDHETIAVIVAGLLPRFRGQGTGSEVMQRIATPMVGGMITAPLLSMLVLPAPAQRHSD